MIGKTHLTSTFFRPYRQQVTETKKCFDSFNLQQSPQKFRQSLSPPKFQRQYYYNENNYDFGKQNRYFGGSPSLKYDNKSYTRRQYRDYRDTSRSKKSKYDNIRSMHEPIWDYLYNKGLEVQNQIMEQHQRKKQRIDVQCTFQPMIRKNSRYLIPSSSNFLQRNKVWHQNKIQRIIKEKEEEVTKNLQDCTFKPKLNEYYRMNKKRQPLTHAYRHIKGSKSMKKLQNHKKQQVHKRNQKKAINNEQVGKIKNMIRRELKRIEL